jgi:dihydroflavonol-4-reductase
VTVAVTGSSGHVGAILCRALLERGEEVRLLVHLDSKAIEGLPAQRIRADLNDPDSLRRAFRGTEVVYNLAARIDLDGRHTKLMQRVNIEGTRNVVEACRSCGVGRLIHFSSIEALADLNPQVATAESNPLAAARDTTRYGWTKAESERIVLEAVDRGLDALIISPTAIIGPFDCKPSHLGKSLIDLYHRRMPALVHGGFDWVDVRDVVDGSLTAAQNGGRGQRYILSGNWFSLADLAQLVERIVGSRAPRLTLPLWLAKGISRLAGEIAGISLKYPAFTPDALLAVGKHRKISNDKARRELGYNPRPLEETIRDTFDWFRDNGYLEE